MQATTLNMETQLILEKYKEVVYGVVKYLQLLGDLNIYLSQIQEIVLVEKNPVKSKKRNGAQKRKYKGLEIREHVSSQSKQKLGQRGNKNM